MDREKWQKLKNNYSAFILGINQESGAHIAPDLFFPKRRII